MTNLEPLYIERSKKLWTKYNWLLTLKLEETYVCPLEGRKPVNLKSSISQAKSHLIPRIRLKMIRKGDSLLVSRTK